MNFKLAALGIVTLLSGGCDYLSARNNVTEVGKRIKIDKPEDCAKVLDIRPRFLGYELLCADRDGKLANYSRGHAQEYWVKVSVEE